MSQYSIPFMQIRGGSSKGLYLLRDDLPADEARRDQLLLDLVGRDESQMDGLGGGMPLNSKVAIIALSDQPDVDIDYLFVQVVVGENRVDTTPNCGNILAGVGAFALEAGLLDVQGDETVISVRMLNTDKICELVVQTPDGQITYEGSTSIDGVPGQSAPVICNYTDLAGSSTGALLPTDNEIDVFDEVEVTCIDNGMPVVLMRARDLGISGYESPSSLDANLELRDKLESIRLQAGLKMKLGHVANAAVPKMCLISSPRNGGLINTRTFIPTKCHKSIGVLGAVSVATACLLPGSVAQGLAEVGDGGIQSVEHPSGQFAITLELDHADDKVNVTRAGVVRTARLLSRGEAYLPQSAN